MTIKEVKEKYKFHHIFINGNEIYHKDNSLDNRKVKSIKEKEYFFGSKAVYVTIWNNYFKEVLTMPKMKYCYVNIKNEVVSPFFNTKKEAINYLDNGGKVNDKWMFSLEYVRVWSE